MDYLLHIVVVVGLYAIVACALNLAAGYTGLVSMAHAAFFGVGSYSAVLLSLHSGAPFFLTLVVAAAAGGVAGAIVGAPSLRLRGDYFVIATFAFQVVFFEVLNNGGAFTGGPAGLAVISKASVFGWELSSRLDFLAIVLLGNALVLLGCFRISVSPFGRVLKAIREDEVFVQSCGRSVAAFKIRVFVLSASVTAVAGAIYAWYIAFIDPTSFTVTESIFMVCLVIVGGAGRVTGPALGALVLVTLPECLRFFGFPASIAANAREILYGSLLVVMMLLRPKGLLGEYDFGSGQ